MSRTEPPMFITTGCMTLTKACNHQKMMDAHWPEQARKLRWKNCRTGQPVSIGYT